MSLLERQLNPRFHSPIAVSTLPDPDERQRCGASGKDRQRVPWMGGRGPAEHTEHEARARATSQASYSASGTRLPERRQPKMKDQNLMFKFPQ